MKVYHVTPKWDGGDLKSLARQVGEAEAIETFMRRWQCDDAAFAADQVTKVFFFRTLAEAEAMQADYGGEILEIDATDITLRVDDTEGVEYLTSYYPVDAELIHRVD